MRFVENFADTFSMPAVPPRLITILDELGDERTSVVGPYREGQRLHLQCHVYGGKSAVLLKQHPCIL